MNKFFRRNWPTIVAMYTGGAVAAFTGYGFIAWEWWAAVMPACFAIGGLGAYRERYLKALDKW